MPAIAERVWRRRQAGRLITTAGGDTMYSIRLSNARHRGRCRKAAAAGGDARYLAGGQTPDPGDEAAPGRAASAGRPGRHRRAEGHQGGRRQRHDRRHDHAMPTVARLGRGADGHPGAGRAGRRHRRPRGAQHGHDRRLARQQRPGGLLPGRACWAWAPRSTPTSAGSPPTTSSRACSRPRWSRARSSPRSASRCRRRRPT